MKILLFKNEMDKICYLSIIPDEILKYIISLTENKVFDLCLINKYFNNNCKVIRLLIILNIQN